MSSERGPRATTILDTRARRPRVRRRSRVALQSSVADRLRRLLPVPARPAGRVPARVSHPPSSSSPTPLAALDVSPTEPAGSLDGPALARSGPAPWSSAEPGARLDPLGPFEVVRPAGEPEPNEPLEPPEPLEPLEPLEPNEPLEPEPRLTRRHIVAILVLLALLALGAGVMAWRNRPTTEAVAAPIARPSAVMPASAPGTGRPTPSPTSSPTSSPPPAIVVYVVGKVRHPGLVQLPPNARVADALRAAGGTRAGFDPTSLNLAQPLADGQQVLVGVAGKGGSSVTGGSGTPGSTGAGSPGTATGAGSGAGAGGSTGPAAPIDLNTATLDQLDTLPGVGPVLAQRILDYRTRKGRFDSVNELREVSGIGERRFADLRDLLVVS